MCIDFTNFNKACSKDNSPLPSIDHLVDAKQVIYSFGLGRLGKMVFIIEDRLFYYWVMPFGFKNARATY
ncbi:Transposon Ty3-I Gag-Pol polyprotein [Gossypium australe]|uniref:Transposon Ty3-I Gag-Pol polyprotein n=1 Tax=Gossypium australe TaxID=47621 RepID=A0A5B6XA14_9ROSI|nr:Transposon Ty3-I Gag-Pol polyprotein [Gossypium australe]